MQTCLANLPALRTFLSQTYEDDTRGFKLCEAVTCALEEQLLLVATASGRFEDLKRRPSLAPLVLYLRALRACFSFGDDVFSQIIRARGVVTSLCTLLFLVEAHVALPEAFALYESPLNEVCDEQFGRLGFRGDQWPMAHESAEALKVRSKPAVTATSNVSSALRILSNWTYDNPVCEFTSFELDARLEYLTWLCTAQLFGPGCASAGDENEKGRTPAWLVEFESMFSLVRARAHVMCTLPLPLCVIDEEHRSSAASAKFNSGGSTSNTSGPSTAPKRVRLTLEDFDGASDGGKGKGKGMKKRRRKKQQQRRITTATSTTQPPSLPLDDEAEADADSESEEDPDDFILYMDDTVPKARSWLPQAPQLFESSCELWSEDDGGDDDDDDPPPPPLPLSTSTSSSTPQQQQQPKQKRQRPRQKQSQSQKQQTTDVPKTVSVSPLYAFCIGAYVTSLEAELLLSHSLRIVATPRTSESRLRKIRRTMAEQVAELDDAETMHRFSQFVARSALLPCDYAVHAARTNQRDPAPDEIATAKNHNMVAPASNYVIGIACTHTRLFGDFSLDFLLRTRFDTAARFPTDATVPGFAGGCVSGFAKPLSARHKTRGAGSTGWSWRGTSFSDETRIKPGEVDDTGDDVVDAGNTSSLAEEDSTQRLPSEGPTLCELVAQTPRARPFIMRCALLDIFCVHPGRGVACNAVVSFSSLLAAMIYMRRHHLLPPDLSTAFDDITGQNRDGDGDASSEAESEEEESEEEDET